MVKTWVYTWNNYTEENIETLKLLEVNRHRCCKELSSTNTPHLQGFITFSRNYSLKQLKKLFNDVHWEPALCKDAMNYCIKGEIVIDSSNNKQGNRTDLTTITDMIKNGCSMREVAQEHPTTYIRYYRGFQALQQALAPAITEFKPLDVIVLVGLPGTGKSRRAYSYDQALYNIMEPNNNNTWFDGYTGQKTILLDDYYGWFKYHTLLQYLDGYPMQLPIKGGHIGKNWDTVYITSNKLPQEWYDRSECAALMRRITEIIKLI